MVKNARNTNLFGWSFDLDSSMHDMNDFAKYAVDLPRVDDFPVLRDIPDYNILSKTGAVWAARSPEHALTKYLHRHFKYQAGIAYDAITRRLGNDSGAHRHVFLMPKVDVSGELSKEDWFSVDSMALAAEMAESLGKTPEECFARSQRIVSTINRNLRFSKI